MTTQETRPFAPNAIQRIPPPRELLPQNTPDLVNYYSQPRTPELRAANATALEALNRLIPLDYMGSSEFEWGTIPKALRGIVQGRASFVPIRISCTGRPHAWSPQGEAYAARLSKKTSALYGWCLPNHAEDLQRFVHEQVRGDDAALSKHHLIERSNLQEGCFGTVRENRRNRSQGAYFVEETRLSGWLSLDDGWFLSTVPAQTDQLAYILGVSYAAPAG